MGGKPMNRSKYMFLVEMALVILFITHCSTSGEGRKSLYPPKNGDAAIDKSKPTIVCLMPYTKDTSKVFDVMYSEIGQDFNLVSEHVTVDTSISELGNMLESISPDAIVLMNNPTVRLYQSYQKKLGFEHSYPPAMILLTSYARETAVGAKSTFGIMYEIPGVTLFTNLRNLLEKKVERVGVISREGFEAFVSEQRDLMKIEEFELINQPVRSRPSPREIRLAVKRLYRRKVDALWVLNDNGILRPDLIMKGWVPALSQLNLPAVVGVSTLVSDTVEFGSFGVLPDHTALGVQAANLLFDLADLDWVVSEAKFELPFSVRLVVDANQANRVGFIEDYRLKVDRVIGNQSAAAAPN